MSRMLIIAGIVLIVAGLAIKLGLPLGRLPGDIAIHRGNSSFYFPIVTCIVVSVILTIIGMLMKKL